MLFDLLTVALVVVVVIPQALFTSLVPPCDDSRPAQGCVFWHPQWAEQSKTRVQSKMSKRLVYLG